LPHDTVAQAIPTYEHLDFLWASDVDRQVFGYVFSPYRRTIGVLMLRVGYLTGL
jgi:hypothetical protein